MAFQWLTLGLLSAGRSCPIATVPLGLTNPLAKTVWRTAQFAGDRGMRCCVASIFVTMLRDKPHRALAELIFNALPGNG